MSSRKINRYNQRKLENQKKQFKKNQKKSSNKLSFNDLENKYRNKIKKISDMYSSEEKFDKSGERIQSETEYIKVALIEAEKLWYRLQCIIASNGQGYLSLSDDKKIELFKEEFKQFYNEFPIPSRYIICMGQYKRKAFEKYLKKCRNAPIDEKKRIQDKNYMQDQWIQRQADYVKYLWEEYQNTHYDRKEAKKIWKQAYGSLKKEFSDFHNMYDEIENKVQKDELKHKNQLLKEIIHRVKTSDQNVSVERVQELLEMLKHKRVKAYHKKVMNQINENIKLTLPSYESYGSNIYEGERYEYELKQSKIIKQHKRKQAI